MQWSFGVGMCCVTGNVMLTVSRATSCAHVSLESVIFLRDFVPARQSENVSFFLLLLTYSAQNEELWGVISPLISTLMEL